MDVSAHELLIIIDSENFSIRDAGYGAGGRARAGRRVPQVHTQEHRQRRKNGKDSIGKSDQG